MPLISFYFLILSSLDALHFFLLPNALARTSSTMLNRSGKHGHPGLFSDLRGKAFGLSLLIVMVSLCFPDMPLAQVEEVSFYS